MTPKLLICGDPHGQFDHIIEAVESHQPVAIILLGDIQPKRPLDQELASILDKTQVWWIHGNHDTDSDADFDNLFNSGLSDRNLHGQVVDIAGVKVAGLGGIFRGQVWYPDAPPRFHTPAQFLANCGKGNRWREGLPRKHRSTIFPEDISAFNEQRADILVTHEAPSYHPHGFSVIDELAKSLGVRSAFHGHLHENTAYLNAFENEDIKAYGVADRCISDVAGLSITSLTN
ncbi:MAG: metallophosphoesterase [Moraxellaceae bacterium]|nr:metallophosphoesterase [Moraxellaceae bacterium]MDZ4386761.1 metallophosphoesterase [Moraxellaceae bacterium]